MEMIKIDSRRLKVMLEREELLAYGLTVGELDYENAKTRALFADILARAKEICGFESAFSSLALEVYPSRQGGCEIFLTKSGVSRKNKEASVASFDEIELAIAASAAFLQAGYVGESFLYRLCGRYYLVLFLENELSEALLYEFGSEEGESVYGVLKREGQLLSASAVERFGKMALLRGRCDT